MKKILSIFVISLLIVLNASAEIIDLKCVWNNGYTIPNEDVSSNKGKVNFYKIDLKNKKVKGSPHGYYENNKSEYSDTWVHVKEDTISFGIICLFYIVLMILLLFLAFYFCQELNLYTLL